MRTPRDSARLLINARNEGVPGLSPGVGFEKGLQAFLSLGLALQARQRLTCPPTSTATVLCLHGVAEAGYAA